jgi:hypothetical protein
MSNTRTPVVKKAAAKKASADPGLREALALKIRRVEHFDIPIVESAVVTAKTLKLTEAQEALAYARITDPKSVQQREDALAAAKRDVAACFHRTFFKGLPTLDMEALQNEHPDPKLKEGEKLPEDHIPFVFWLAAATCTEGDLTPEEWKGYADEWTVGTLNRFTDAVFGSTTKDFSHGIPKD